jgi:hypothetical protein
MLARTPWIGRTCHHANSKKEIGGAIESMRRAPLQIFLMPSLDRRALRVGYNTTASIVSPTPTGRAPARPDVP